MFLNKVLIKFFDYDLLRVIGIKKLRKKSENYLRTKANLFYEEFLHERINQEPLLLVNELREQGYIIILISGTLDFLANEIAKRIRADEVYSTKLVYDENGDCEGYIDIDLLGNKHLVLNDIEKRCSQAPIIYTITENKTDMNIINRSTYRCIVSLERDINYWKKKLNHEFKLIRV